MKADVEAQIKYLKLKMPSVFLLVGPSVPPAVSYTKRGQALSVESDHREEWDGARRLELSTSKGDVPASPLGVQERKKTSSAVGVRKWRVGLLRKSHCLLLLLL